jgi:uracil-DNA glycosylase
MIQSLSFKTVHPSWHAMLDHALQQVDPHYLTHLIEHTEWLPGLEQLFNAFSLPRSETRFILLGESPYPRAASANGYAFWDAAVTQLWSDSGLSKPVNRATSLRNFIKMLLISEGLLTAEQTSQVAIAALNKTQLVQTAEELFQNLLKKGFLLLNATLVLSPQGVRQDAKAWKPFLIALLQALAQEPQRPTLLLFGNVAKTLEELPSVTAFERILSEHPYNISFITNPTIQAFFGPLRLLRNYE